MIPIPSLVTNGVFVLSFCIDMRCEKIPTRHAPVMYPEVRSGHEGNVIAMS